MEENQFAEKNRINHHIDDVGLYTDNGFGRKF
jgi:hypothetical protein